MSPDLHKNLVCACKWALWC